MSDLVSHPPHYTKWPVEVIEITRHLGFDTGNAVKYILRHNDKDNPRQDIEKAIWYLKDVREEKGPTTDGIPFMALYNLMKLLVADQKMEHPLNDLVVESLYSIAVGDISRAISLLEDYLDS